MACKIKVDLGARSYEIRVGEGVLAQVGALCRELELGPSALVVSDEHVNPLYGPAVESSLRAAGFQVGRVAVPAGESSKAEARLFRLYDEALDRGLDRRAFVVALGGGVVGDLAGYFAASYLRGIRYVQVPTSLLAMVDSSVGGKTGINLPRGKNLVGAFHQPVLVAADITTLRSLPPREYAAGLAEVVKYGVIRDAAFFARLEANLAGLRSGEPALLEDVIAHCCRIKAEVVRLDERERSLRAILNFGHTLGHALEQVTGYGTYLHGEAVSLGMAFAARLSTRLAGLPADEAERIENLLRALGLPVDRPDLDWSAARRAMTLDKKTQDRVLKFVLADRIGAARPGVEAPDAVLEEVWTEGRQPKKR
ncbi:MAG TPA: 3-dehydroquinate synthase [Kiritimatiellia bacterium]|nr:3-dehydroquinate synthase [Kiritimatiellia bacterium]HRZ13628.1 3-dehydroquinate synthase [Kiritimatiellia bacterium]HSA19276.1 3-dehydroquinate synthase [Kiritimatiellia bacterium]